MATPNAAQALAKWQQRVAGAGNYYTQGIQNSGDWAANAVAAGPARDAGLQRAIADGKIDRGINRVGTAGWRSKTLAKGPTNWQQGVSSPAAAQAYTQGYQRLLGYLDAGHQALAQMPRGGFQNNMQRMTAFITAVHNAAQQQ